MTIDGKIVESTKSFSFPKKGEHTVLIKSNFIKLTSARRMFYKVTHLIKLEFHIYLILEISKIWDQCSMNVGI